jgi:hypothetical protein
MPPDPIATALYYFYCGRYSLWPILNGGKRLSFFQR